MTYYPPTERPAGRPRAVTAGAYALFVSSVAIASNSVLSVVGLQAVEAAYRRTPDTTDTWVTAAPAAKLGTYGGLVVNAVTVTLLVIGAIFVLRGVNAMRITVWVVGGVSALCFACGSYLSIASTAGATATAGSTVDLPGWFAPVNVVLAVVNLIALTLGIVLLTLPTANAFFRPPVAHAGDRAIPAQMSPVPVAPVADPYAPSADPPA